MSSNFTPSEHLPCDDFLQFTKLLTLWRKADDRVRYELNAALPTASFKTSVDCTSKCRSFVEGMLSDHEMRNRAIKTCLDRSANQLMELKNTAIGDSNNHEVSRRVRKEQTLLRQFQTELLEEEIIQSAAMKVIYERCREHFQHPTFDRFK